MLSQKYVCMTKTSTTFPSGITLLTGTLQHCEYNLFKKVANFRYILVFMQ